MLFISIVGLALVLTFVELKFHFLPLALAAALAWLVPAVGLLVDPDAVGLSSLTGTLPTLLAFVLILLVFVPIGHFWMRMGKQEITVTGNGKSYKMWGKPPEEKVESRSAKVKRERRATMSSLGSRRRV